MFMNNKILLLALISTFSSCSIFQNTKTITQDIDSSVIESNDVLQKFLGTYEIEVFNLPDGGDGKFSMKVTKEGDGLKTTFTTEEASQTIDIVGTQVEAGEITRLARDIAGGASGAKALQKLEKLPSGVKKVFGKLQESYIAEDDFWKITTF